MDLDDEAGIRAALSRTKPPITGIGDMRGESGYVNDIWYFDSSAGQLVAKVRNMAEEDPEQIKTYLAGMKLLSQHAFPTPGLVFFEESCDHLDGRQLSVLEQVPGVAATEAIASVDDHQQLLGKLGETVGQLHSIDVPVETVWRDDAGATHEDCLGVVLSSLAEAEAELQGRVDGQTPIVHQVAARIRDDAPEMLAVVDTPRLVHRDLHLGNFLIDGDEISALLDFEMVREWDPAFDFVKIRDSIYRSGPEAEDAFLAGYRARADIPDGFDTRVHLYEGLHHLLSVVEFLDGNDRYSNSLHDLQRWLDRR